MGAAAAPDGKRVYISTGRGRRVVALDPATDSIVGSVEAGVRPWGIALTRDGSKLYAANGPSGDVSVVDTKTMMVVKTVKAGSSPGGVAVGLRTEDNEARNRTQREKQ
jgi:YVTN family beta-propeller protein